MPYQSFQPTYCSKGGIITQQAPVILLLILLYSTYILTLPSTFEQSQVAPPEFAHYSNFSRISYPWIGRTDNLPKYTPMWVKRSNVQDTIYKASFLSSFPPDNGVTVQKVDQLEKDPPNTELDRKEVRTSPSERVTSFPETYWVEAGKKGSGVNESFPSGNITYVLRHYNLTNAVVKVKPGTYGASIENFPLTVSDRNVTLEGTSQSSETIITQGSTLSSIGIKITGDFVTVRRFTIVEASFGIELYHSQYHTITGNRITENDVGIKMSSSNFNRIDNNHITQNQCGLCLESSESNRINGNTFQANTYGSYLLSSPKNVVKTNKIIKNIERGVRLWRSNNNLVYNNKFLQNEVGLEVRACVSISVEHNVITGNELGLYFYDLSNFNKIKQNIITRNGYGVHLEGSRRNVISSNTFLSNLLGSYLDHANRNAVAGNTFTNHSVGCYMNGSRGNTVKDNIMWENRMGFFVDGPARDHYEHKIVNNFVEGKRAYFLYNLKNTILELFNTTHLTLAFCDNITLRSSVISEGDFLRLINVTNSLLLENHIVNTAGGIRLSHASNNLFSRNSITNNGEGLFLSNFSHTNSVQHNNFTNNGIGVRVIHSTDNILSQNNFVGNRVQAVDAQGGNNFNNSVIGNYWDDYTGRDTDENGIGDTPYNILGEGGSKDYLPAIHPGNGEWNMKANAFDSLWIGLFFGIVSMVAIGLVETHKWVTSGKDIVEEERRRFHSQEYRKQYMNQYLNQKRRNLQNKLNKLKQEFTKGNISRELYNALKRRYVRRYNRRE